MLYSRQRKRPSTVWSLPLDDQVSAADLLVNTQLLKHLLGQFPCLIDLMLAQKMPQALSSSHLKLRIPLGYGGMLHSPHDSVGSQLMPWP